MQVHNEYNKKHVLTGLNQAKGSSMAWDLSGIGRLEFVNAKRKKTNRPNNLCSQICIVQL